MAHLKKYPTNYWCNKRFKGIICDEVSKDSSWEVV